MRRFSLILVTAALLAGVFLFAAPAPAAAASEQEQLAALGVQVQSLWKLLDSFKQKLAKPAYAVAACSDGIDNDNDGQVDYPSDTGCYGPEDSDEAYYPASGTSSSSTTYWSSSCSASLTSLLGTGCHYMYNDSSGRAIYCDGPMSMSAKEGDTATTAGCSHSSSTTSTYTYSSSTSCSSGTQSSCAADTNCTWITAGNNVTYCDVKSSYAGDANSCPGFAYSQWDSTSKRYCKLNKATACQYNYPAYLDSNNYSVYNCPSSGGTTSSTQTTTTSTQTTTTTTGTAGTASSANLAAAVSDSDVTLTWTDFYQGESEYQIERRVGTGAWVKIGASAYLAGGNGTYKDTAVPAGTYDYHVKPCTTSTGCYGESNTARVTVGGTSTSTTAPRTATPAPVISGVAPTYITSNSATITWVTDIPANSKVEYGIGTASNVVSEGTFVTNHSISLGGLAASTTYIYNVISENTDYYRTTFSNQKFATLQSGTVTGPSGSCDSALTALLGTGCHYMYSDSSGRAIYCDGPMTKSAKQGDTATTAGCSSGSSASTNSNWSSHTWRFKDGSTRNSQILSRTDAEYASFIASVDSSAAGGYFGGWKSGAGTDANWQEFGIPIVSQTPTTGTSRCVYFTQTSCTADAICAWANNGCGSKAQCNDGVDNDRDGLIDYPQDPGCVDYFGDYEGPGSSTAQCSDGRDNDNDGFIDYPNDTSCYGPDDNDEYYPVSGQTGTTTPTAIPAVPSDLTAVQSGSDVVLSWNDNSINEDRYQVEWNNGTSWVSFGSTGILYGGRGTYTDRSPSLRTHQYRVKACNSLGCSAVSNVASITLGAVSAPAVSFLSPSSGPIGTKVVLSGSGFSPTGNRVNFDTGVIPDLPSADGKTITFAVPEDRVPYCAIFEPRCLLPAPYNPVKPGTYWVSVTNANGASGAMQFSVIETVASVFAVDPAGASPKSGAVGMDVGTRVKVKFTRELDPLSMAKEFFRFAKTGVPDARVSGSFSVFSDGFEFTPSAELESNTGYTYTVLTTIRDRSGLALSSPYTASFTTGGASRSSATLTGKVTDADGAPVGRAYVHVYPPYVVAYSQTAGVYQGNFWRNTETDPEGSYKLSLPSGTYIIEIYAPFGRTDLTRVAPREITVAAGDTRTVNFIFGGAIKVISGNVTFSNGTAVADAEVAAYSPETRQWKNAPVGSAGGYTVKVGGGAWFVGIHPREARKADWSWDEKPRVVTFTKDPTAETKTVDFTVPLRNATISVTAVDDAGTPLGSVGVVADSHSSAATAESFAGAPPEFRITGSDGKAKFTLRAGTYYIRAYIPPDRGYFNPGEEVVVLAGGDSKEVKLVFRKKETAQKLTIGGVTKLEEGIPVDAFIWAWSERGGFASARADTGGQFSFTVIPNERWHIGAGKEYKGFPYKSPELVVDVKAAPVSIELVLTKQTLAPLPPTVNVTQAAAQQVVAQAADGASITLPPSSAASSGTVQVEIKPTVEAPSQAGTDVVSTVYDVTVHDSSGASVSTLSHEAEIVIPYNEADLKAQGVTEDAIVPSYFDEKTGTWVNLEGCTIDKERNVAVCQVDHLTKFAITARADTTPPDAPSAATGSALGGGKVKLTWKNPAKDFDYAKVYRSAKAGELGTVRAATVRASQYTDSEGLSDGAIYYYTVRAVDPAGNESVNVVQVTVAAKGTSGAAVSAAAPAAAGGIARTLRKGMRGDDVKVLQKVLIAGGLLASGSDSGYFGPATEAALKKFQTKAGLEAVGIVGPATRKKVNEMR